ncbi:hypothetical protein MJO28_002366 [Puccinia striiformis f. sp. tritici]|uniref:Uncharacterized protein n=3 Tax=Puccinia striiformis TaxID=27350 RepID=A0A0L0UY99_9BASI|nr:hypothetical protein MJO28_002366 [Puccinia striiformis f. sp. tritici]KAI7966698.1 hypothetical protein MJO29_002446 [Puccinia striiformis f. sp. tritici]KAI9609856.1 hypothetical protein H4Q26_006845 [Puccinia striiformis f. sp. tritici PST-130]KNE91911.1 hypothetical protein PSTG_14707 [Puccinia striiformis f. sp. tritici PST-78]POW07442.1 hypothetical protein PSTT_08261 [Puccinia striiformis]
MSKSNQPSNILCPLPRRTHSNPIYNNNKLNKQKKALESQLANSDEVLSEFLSLFTTTPSEPTRLIYNNNKLDASNHSSQPSSPIRTTTSTPLSSPSSSTPPPPPPLSQLPPAPKPNHLRLNQLVHDQTGLHSRSSSDLSSNLGPQIGLVVAPNHLSSIVSSPISRCHNPLPRHAELDVLASRLPKPFETFENDHHQSHPLSEEEEQLSANPKEELSSLLPALNLDPDI